MSERRRAGKYVRIGSGAEAYDAFVPAPLPPNPPMAPSAGLDRLHEDAALALGRLDGVSRVLANPALFIYMYVRKEAVLSSQIEGTHSSLSDLLLHETKAAPGAPEADVREVSRYVEAMEHGLKRLRGGFPLSLRLIREVHAVLMQGARGGNKAPGEFRRTQNWIGGSRPWTAKFVPPPPSELGDSLDRFERFLHDDVTGIPPIMKAGMAHAQFETIHPFLDGNGRSGRLLITLMLCSYGVLSRPLLYLSLYFKAHRRDYYGSLDRIRSDGDWEGWISFFLKGVTEVSNEASDVASKLLGLFEVDRETIQAGRRARSTLQVHEVLKRRAIVSVKTAAKMSGLSEPAVLNALRRLIEEGIVHEITGRARDRRYAYRKYLRVLNEGTQTPA